MEIPGAEDRELGTLIRQYREHREALRRLSAAAPDGRLAERYERLVEGLSKTIDRLTEMQRIAQEGELEDLSLPLIDEPSPRVDPTETSTLRQSEDDGLAEDTDEREVEPEPEPWTAADFRSEAGTWDKPLVHDASDKPEDESSMKTPLLLLLLIGVPVLLVLIWMKATGQPESLGETTAPVENSAEITEETSPEPRIVVSPASHDYGPVRAGSRATSYFAIQNNSGQPLEISVDRSSCRCLWYDVPEGAIAPGESARLTVTVDGSKVEGPLAETVVIRGPDSASLAEIDIDAVVGGE